MHTKKIERAIVGFAIAGLATALTSACSALHCDVDANCPDDHACVAGRCSNNTDDFLASDIELESTKVEASSPSHVRPRARASGLRDRSPT